MNLKDCTTKACLWNGRYEILGLVFLVLATFLTIRASDSFGIVAMFVVGLLLVGHKHFCYRGCHSSCHAEDCTEESCAPECTTKSTIVTKKKMTKDA